MIEEIKKIVEDFFKSADIAVAGISVQSRGPGEPLEINLTTDEAGYLIGERGANLKDFEFVLRLMVKKKFPDCRSVFLDINGYRREREEMIRSQARQAAKEAVLKKESVMLTKGAWPTWNCQRGRTLPLKASAGSRTAGWRSSRSHEIN